MGNKQRERSLAQKFVSHSAEHPFAGSGMATSTVLSFTLAAATISRATPPVLRYQRRNDIYKQARNMRIEQAGMFGGGVKRDAIGIGSLKAQQNILDQSFLPVLARAR